MTLGFEDWELVQIALAQRIGLSANDIVLAAFKLGWWELVARWARLDGKSATVWIAEGRRKYLGQE